MARVALANCSPPLRSRAKEAAARLGTVSVLNVDGNAANVYAGPTGTPTLTSTAVPYKAGVDALQGWVDEGEYQISVAGYVQKVIVQAGSTYFRSQYGQGIIVEPSVGASNAGIATGAFAAITTTGSATTTQVIKLVRITVPAPLVAAKILTEAGTAVA